MRVCQFCNEKAKTEPYNSGRGDGLKHWLCRDCGKAWLRMWDVATDARPLKLLFIIHKQLARLERRARR